MRTLILALALTLSAASADAAAWSVDQGKSKLGFSVVWSGEPLKASFKKWTADIDFDPADPSHARVLGRARTFRYVRSLRPWPARFSPSRGHRTHRSNH